MSLALKAIVLLVSGLSLLILLLALLLLGPHLAQRETDHLRIVHGSLKYGEVDVTLEGVMYYQPHAFHHYFWEELDIPAVGRDFERISRQGFNAIAIQVNWGSFVSSLDEGAKSTVYNQVNEQKLLGVLTAARKHGLFVILWFTWSRIPENVSAKRYEGGPDAGGLDHDPFLGYLLHNYPGIAQAGTYVWQSFVEFHQRIAKIAREFGNIIYDPLDWQHLNMNVWSWDDEANLRAWWDFLKEKAEELDYWNARWGEDNGDWNEVLFPADSWVRDTIGGIVTSRYHGLEVLPFEAKKWNDFNEWHNGLTIQAIREITEAIREGDPDALIGQRIDLWRFGAYRDETWGTGGVDLYFAGDYPQDKYEGANASRTVSRMVDALRDRQWVDKPVIFWETGIDVGRLYPGEDKEQREERRANYLATLDEAVRHEALLGWCWWVWRDYYLDQNSMDWGLVTANDEPKPALLKVAG